MTDDLERSLGELLAERAAVNRDDVEPLRRFVAALPSRRRGRVRSLLAIAAGVVVMLGVGAIALVSLPQGQSGAAPSAPDPRAFTGDPRLGSCGARADDAIAIFEMAHLSDYQRHLPAAFPLTGLQADGAAPALVVVFGGPASPGRDGSGAPPGSHDLCLVVGPDAAGAYEAINVVGVDTTGLLAYLPEPTGTPIVADLAPWTDRCGGSAAGIGTVLQFADGSDAVQRLLIAPRPPELSTDQPVTIVVYAGTHPFPPLGTPPPGAATVAPRAPQRDGLVDLCVLVGADPATATRTIHEDVRFAEHLPAPSGDSFRTPGASSTPPAGAGLPPQLAPAECETMSFAAERCLAVVESARGQLGLAWADIAAVHLSEIGVVSLGGRDVATVTFDLQDGTSAVQDVRCGGIFIYSLVCTDHPQVLLIAPYGSGGYTDTPCGAVPGGEPGSACATPLPTIDPSAAADAVPLEVPERDIPITATGHLEIDIGRATLPDGILSDARFSLADPATDAFRLDGGIALVVRSLDPARPPFENLYQHGWYPGTEAVEVVLILDVTSFTPGAMLEVRDLVVR